jgi:UDP-glucose 4-epimerase
MKTARKILITGGAGSVGKDYVASLLEKGCDVTVLDRDVNPLKSVDDSRLILIEGSLEDRKTLQKAIEGVDAVIHLAWSFSADTLEIFEQDLKGHIYLLDEMASRKIQHLIYTSTAVVYGNVKYSPIDEDHPLVVEEARKPLYGIAKAAAEKLCLMYSNEGKVPATIFRFWWAFGEDIAGRHLREMLKTAAAGEVLEVPGDSGGSFIHMADLVQAMDIVLMNEAAYGKTFNFSTAYVTWEEVAEMVSEVTGSLAGVRVIPKGEWKGSAFLADTWELSDTYARDLLGYKPMDPEQARDALKKAISNRWEGMKKTE